MERAVAMLQTVGEFGGNKHSADGVPSRLTLDGSRGSVRSGAGSPAPKMNSRLSKKMQEGSAQPPQGKNQDDQV